MRAMLWRHRIKKLICRVVGHVPVGDTSPVWNGEMAQSSWCNRCGRVLRVEIVPTGV